MTKNKLAYSLIYGSPYSCKQSFPSVSVCGSVANYSQRLTVESAESASKSLRVLSDQFFACPVESRLGREYSTGVFSKFSPFRDKFLVHESEGTEAREAGMI
jgi:hypothetical protein